MITRDATLAIPSPVFQRLHRHLFPGDGLEAAALVLCTQVSGRRRKLLACDLIPVPYEACARRSENFLSWPGEFVERAIDRAEASGLVILAVHSHPGGLFAFSPLDDESDKVLLPALFHGTGGLAGSAIMLPNGAMRGRLYDGYRNVLQPLDLISVAADDRNEGHPLGIEQFHQLGEVRQRTGQPVDLIDDDDIDLPSFDAFQEMLQGRAFG